MTRLYVALGKLGDIIGILPLLSSDFASAGVKSGLMVSKDYASLLDGCSYLEPVVFDGDFNDIVAASEQAKAMCEDVRVCQLAGPRNAILKEAYEKIGLHVGDPQPESFNKESWRLAGRFNDWRLQHPLIFDQRNPDREQALRESNGLFPTKKKWILVALDSVSSPFPHKGLVMELLRLKCWRDAEIIDLSTIKAERFYDFLGIYEHHNTHAIVAADTAHLHLAYACKRLPVAAFIQDSPTLFYGSAWRPNHIFHCRYGDATARLVEMLDAITSFRKPGGLLNPNLRTHKFVHVWSRYDVSEENSARHQEAKENWREQYKNGHWLACPIEVGAVGRDSRTVIGEQVRYPYVKDVIRNAMLRCEDEDVIVFTRADTCFVNPPDAGLEQVLAEFPRSRDPYCFFAFRRAKDGSWQRQVADLFIFTKQWWRQNQGDFPDMVMGHDPFWPNVLMEMFRQKGASELKGVIYRGMGKVVPVVASGYRNMNRTLSEAWMKDHGLVTAIPPVHQQMPAAVINRKALHNGAYNPSIIRFQNRTLMAYRWHSDSTLATSLAIAELDDKFNVIGNESLETGHKGSSEDPHLFRVGDDLWCSYIASKWPDSLNCVVRFGRLVHDENVWRLVDQQQPNAGKNDWSGTEKNWIMFGADRDGFDCLYHSHPKQTILHFGKALNHVWGNPTDFPAWGWGEPHGGAIVPWKGKLLRFFHSRLYYEGAESSWRYFVGCCLMNPEPPYEVIKISSEPLLKGSDEDILTSFERERCFHHKTRVAFVGGAVAKDDHVLVSLGINDSSCVLVRFREEDLKL